MQIYIFVNIYGEKRGIQIIIYETMIMTNIPLPKFNVFIRFVIHFCAFKFCVNPQSANYDLSPCCDLKQSATS